MLWRGCGASFRRLVGAFAGALTVALVAAPAAGAAGVTFTAHGSAEQVYVVGLRGGERMSLVSAAGQTVARRNADSLGGLLFRNVRPGAGYRVRQDPNGSESPPVTVFSNRPAPPSTSVYGQTIPASGYSYLTTRDGTQLAIDVHPPQQPAGEPGLPTGV